MKVRIIGVLCAAVLAAFTVLSVLPVNGEEKIYTDLIRLHVIANSDSGSDQELKLKVRDAVLKEAGEMGLNGGKETAETILTAGKRRLENAAQQVIEQEGYDYPVKIELGSERYPERVYDDFTLPAGEYTSLKVVIGSGEGHNWWCVIYPPLCTSAAEKREEVFIEAGFTGEQYRAITQAGKTKYKVKFKIAEIFEDIFGAKRDNEK